MARLLDLLSHLQKGEEATCTTASLTQITISPNGERFMLTHYLLEGEWEKPQYFSIEELTEYARKGTSDGWTLISGSGPVVNQTQTGSKFASVFRKNN